MLFKPYPLFPCFKVLIGKQNATYATLQPEEEKIGTK